MSSCACLDPDARTCFELRYFGWSPAEANREDPEDCYCHCHITEVDDEPVW